MVLDWFIVIYEEIQKISPGKKWLVSSSRRPFLPLFLSYLCSTLPSTTQPLIWGCQSGYLKCQTVIELPRRSSAWVPLQRFFQHFCHPIDSPERLNAARGVFPANTKASTQWVLKNFHALAQNRSTQGTESVPVALSRSHDAELGYILKQERLTVRLIHQLPYVPWWVVLIGSYNVTRPRFLCWTSMMRGFATSRKP